MYRFSGFIKFCSTERNTGNTMSYLYFNEESDYSEQNAFDNEVICKNEASIMQKRSERNRMFLL